MRTKKEAMMKLGLREKIVLTLSLLVITSMGLITFIGIQSGTTSQVQDSLKLLATGMAKHVNIITHKTLSFEKDIHVISNTPPFLGITRALNAKGIDPKQGDSLAIWSHRLDKIFIAFLKENRGVYTQLSFINKNGMELVRVQQQNGAVVAIAKEQLQNKQQENYFKQTLKLAENEIFYSNIALKKEHGRVERPHTAILHIAKVILDENRHVHGILVLQVLAKSIFNTLHSDHGAELSIADNHGKLLKTSRMTINNAFTADNTSTIADINPKLLPILGSKNHYIHWFQENHDIEGFQKIFYDPLNSQKYWTLIFSQPDKFIFKNLNTMRNIMLISGILIGILSLFIIIWYISRKVVQPVMEICETTKKMAAGDLHHLLDPSLQKDEMRELFYHINFFAQQQKELTTDLESQIEQRTESLSNILNNLADAVISINSYGLIESFNPAAEEMFGYQADEVMGKNVKIIMPSKYANEHDDYLAAYRKTGIAKVVGLRREVTGKHHSGREFPLELEVSSTTINNELLFIGVCRDISQEKRVAEKLSKQNIEMKEHALYEHSYNKIVTLFSASINRQKILIGLLDILANEHLLQVSAIYLTDEWSGLLINVASHGTNQTMRKSFDLHDGIVGQACIDGKNIILNKNELNLEIDYGITSFEPEAIMVSPIVFQGKNLGALVVASMAAMTELDEHHISRITMQLGISLNHLNQYESMKELSEQLRVKSVEIKKKNIELERGNRMKSEFLANMSHELRTPLNAIIGFSELMHNGLAGDINEEQKEYTQDIYNSAEHLLSLINDILDLSKIEAGKMELDLSDTSIADLAHASITIIKERASRHAITLELIMNDDIGCTTLDARKVKQILFNLLSNAVKFTLDHGHVTLQLRRISADQVNTTIDNNVKQWLEMSVRDNGIGISKEDIPHLFQPFQQFEDPMTKSHEGTGLGLVLVKRFVELHGGSIAVESEKGKGSCFTCWLPCQSIEMYHEAAERLASSDASTAITTINSPTEQLKNQTQPLVLIIEDDDQAAELLQIQLSDQSFRTERVDSAEHALKWLETHTPDIITLDVYLPGMDGWEFLNRIKHHADYMTIPVVIISVSANTEHGFALGASHVLSKPVNKEGLLHSITTLGFSHANKNTTVLIVDDDCKAIDIISRYLEAESFVVLRAYSGQEGIDTAKKEKPDLIILDLIMPEVSGFDVVDSLKRMPATQHIPIMILTAKVISASDRKRLNNDIVSIMQKNDMHTASFMSEFQRVALAIRRGQHEKS